MKPVLIDSHVFIWLLFEEGRVTHKCRQAIANASEVYVSSASLWELTLKHNKGALKYSPELMVSGYKDLGASLLDVTEQHILETTGLDLPHKDPFYTMLIAQAVSEGMPLLTADRRLLDSAYETVDCTPDK